MIPGRNVCIVILKSMYVIWVLSKNQIPRGHKPSVLSEQTVRVTLQFVCACMHVCSVCTKGAGQRREHERLNILKRSCAYLVIDLS